ncbi:MAG: hypothetical protein ACE5GC_03750 [Acidimicrobiia bacterium]
MPDTNTFHADITWLAGNGITRGCNPPDNTLFCPADAVTREQMAAFMKRLAATRAVDAGSLEGQAASAFLGATATAADSDQLDGVDSTGFVAKGEADAVTSAMIGDEPGVASANTVVTTITTTPVTVDTLVITAPGPG